MSISRRSFFAKVAGAAVATQVLPSLASPVYGSAGGAHVGAIAGSLMGYPIVISELDFPSGDIAFGSLSPVGEEVTFSGVWDDAHLPDIMRRQG
jgi:hypothetical protein